MTTGSQFDKFSWMLREYLDFDVSLESASTGYRVAVASPAGEANAPLQFSLSQADLDQILSGVEDTAVRSNVRCAEKGTPWSPTDLGDSMFRAIFTDEIRDCYTRSIDMAQRSNRGLRIRLRFVDAPFLAQFPWEFLRSKAQDRYLALSSSSPVVRYVELPEPINAYEVEAPLRVLVLVSSPLGYPPLNAEREFQRLRDAVRPLEQKGLVAIDRLADGTLEGLHAKLNTEYHIFHYIGHGEFDTEDKRGYLILEDTDSAAPRRVQADILSTVLHNARSFRLVVLNSCEGARASGIDPMAGVAQTLIKQGIPAVVAMQFQITNRAAVVFASSVYGALASGLPVDAAVTQGRVAIRNSGSAVEWATPVLYMRTDSGKVFAVTVPPMWKQGLRRMREHRGLLVATFVFVVVIAIFVVAEGKRGSMPPTKKTGAEETAGASMESVPIVPPEPPVSSPTLRKKIPFIDLTEFEEPKAPELSEADGDNTIRKLRNEVQQLKDRDR